MYICDETMYMCTAIYMCVCVWSVQYNSFSICIRVNTTAECVWHVHHFSFALLYYTLVVYHITLCSHTNTYGIHAHREARGTRTHFITLR